MNSLIKLVLVGFIGYFGYRAMGGGDEMPTSMKGYVRQADVLKRKLVILITGSDWCGACKAMELEMLRTPEWQQFAGNDIVFQKFDYPSGGMATTQAHRDLLELPGFKGYPTMVVVNGDGKLLDMRAGYGGGAGEYIQWIKSL